MIIHSGVLVLVLNGSHGWMLVSFSIKVSILVNGSPTDEVLLHKGLRQGDPLAPFLFLMITKGFSGLLQNVVALNKLVGLKVGKD